MELVSIFMSSGFRAWLDFKRLLGLDLDYLSTLTEIEAIIVNEAPLRVGSGRGEGLGEIDAPVVRGRDGLPFIPGSSLKGVFRSWLESIYSPEDMCRAGESSHECCSLKTELLYKFVKGIEKRFYKGFELEARELQQLISREIDFDGIAKRYNECESSREIVEKFKGVVQSIVEGVTVLELLTLVDKLRSALFKERLTPCVICRAFGNKALASHVSISDAKPVDGEVRTLTRTRIAIDRFTKTALPKVLFDYEYIPEGYRWRFRIISWNIDVRDLNHDASAKLRLLLNSLASIGLFIGGMKSVGYGLVKLVVEESKAKICSVEGDTIKCEVKPLSELLTQR